LPLRSGCSASTPVSSNPTVTPLPLQPYAPHAASAPIVRIPQLLTLLSSTAGGSCFGTTTGGKRSCWLRKTSWIFGAALISFGRSLSRTRNTALLEVQKLVGCAGLAVFFFALTNVAAS